MNVSRIKNNKQKEVGLLIMEDDVFYSNLLAKKFENFRKSPEIKNRFNIKIEQFNKPEDCLEKAKSLNNSGRPTIAFIDYYLGDGINGQHLIKLLVNHSAKIKIVLMSQSERVIGENKIIKVENPEFTKVIKHEHTPEICCMMLEDYINNL